MYELSNADIEQLYLGCLMIHNGALVKVESISYDYQPAMFYLVNLSTGKKYSARFRSEEFTAPKKRIGFVNYRQTVVYISRRPVRRFRVGIHSENVSVETPAYVPSPLKDKPAVRNRISQFVDVEIYKAYSSQYPTLREAYDKAVEWKGAMAFDKQFAVSFEGVVYYKTKIVGKVKDYVIQWDKDFEYLEIVLGNNYEKNSGTFKATTL